MRGMKTHTVEDDLVQAEQARVAALRRLPELEAQIASARSTLEQLRLGDMLVQAEEELRQAEERAKALREESLRPVREGLREELRAALREAVRAGEVFAKANTRILQIWLRLLETGVEMQALHCPLFVPGSQEAESWWECWHTSLAKDGWLD